LRVEAEEHATETVQRGGIEPGAEVKGIKVTLKPALKITGKVLDEKGEPMTRAWVRARQLSVVDGEPSDQLLGARVQSDGTFSLEKIADGSYSLEVQVWGRGGQSQYETLTRNGVVAGAKDIVLQLRLKEQ
jgi:hypothetical protein